MLRRALVLGALFAAPSAWSDAGQDFSRKRDEALASAAKDLRALSREAGSKGALKAAADAGALAKALFPAEEGEAVPAEASEAAEKAYAQDLQRQGKWVHLWRVAGRYSNISIFDVESVDELHTLLSSLPLFPFMDITVTALARHPSAI